MSHVGILVKNWLRNAVKWRSRQGEFFGLAPKILDKMVKETRTTQIYTCFARSTAGKATKSHAFASSSWLADWVVIDRMRKLLVHASHAKVAKLWRLRNIVLMAVGQPGTKLHTTLLSSMLLVRMKKIFLCPRSITRVSGHLLTRRKIEALAILILEIACCKITIIRSWRPYLPKSVNGLFTDSIISTRFQGH